MIARGESRAETPMPVPSATTASRFILALGTLAYCSLLLLLLAGMFSSAAGLRAHLGGLLLLGAVGAWRISWGALHLVRALVYRKWRFPRWRRAADALGNGGDVADLFVLVTSYRMDAEVTAVVYRALITEAIACGARTVIVPAVTDAADEGLIEDIFRDLAPPERVSLVLMRQAGRGKRPAMSAVLRAISRRHPKPGSVAVLMDGDTVVMPGTLRRCLPFFRLMPDLGALTTDERGVTVGSSWTKEWYDLRFAQRHQLMCSLALSRRVLTLTGRLSMFRAELVVDPSFMELVEADSIDHWRLGRIRFLTGDDKSTWFWLLKRGWAMLYVPDVQIRCLEQLPNRRFVTGSVRLMLRWFGNMLRTNRRAVALGPRPMGLFPWWCLVDQRLSIWTSLLGPVLALGFAMRFGPGVLAGYVTWVMLARLVQGAVIGAVRGRFSPFFPPLLYYNQVVGAAIKLYTSIHLDRQRWTRQGIRSSAGVSAWRSWATSYFALVTVGLFVLAALALGGLAPLPTMFDLRALWVALAEAAPVLGPTIPRTAVGDEAATIQARLDEAAPRQTVQLGPGVYTLPRGLEIRRDHIVLAGAGVGRTVLRAAFEGRDVGVIDVRGEVRPEVAPGRRWILAEEGSPEATVLPLRERPEVAVGDVVAVRIANDPAWLASLGATHWLRPHPVVRQTLAEVATADGRAIRLTRPLGLHVPAGALVVPMRLRRGVTIRDLTIEFALGGVPDPRAYTNLRPLHEVDGIRVLGAAGIEIRNVEILHAGRHPLNLDTVLTPRIAHVRVDGAWNKGPGGNGYFRLARTYHGRLEHIVIRGLRHLTVQWSSHDNIMTHLESDTDISFHGGYTQRNTVQVDRLAPRPGHPWPAVSRTPGGARWAPPDGAGNTVIDARGVAVSEPPTHRNE